MSTDPDGTGALSPDDAFAVLGSETRMGILRSLGEADGPLSFSELRDRVGMRDSGQFNYHLGEVEGHFVRKTDEGYELRQAGRRVVEAVLSGAVTDAPVMEATAVDERCPLCDAPTVVAFSEGQVEHYCTGCDGLYGRPRPKDEHAPFGDGSNESDGSGRPDGSAEYGCLGAFQLPPAGLRGRTPEEVFRAAAVRGGLELKAVASRVCPRCTATVDASVNVCEDHDPEGALCDECGNRHAAQAHFRCTNCLYEVWGALTVALVNDADVLAFLVDHGINPVSPSSPTAYNAVLMDYDEELRSVDPFEARLTLTVDGDALAVTVDDGLTVAEAARR